MGWYYLKNRRQFGPVPETSIRAWLESGFLDADDLVWTEGMSRWLPTAEVPALGGAPAPPVRQPSPSDPLLWPNAQGGSHPIPRSTSYAGFAPRAVAYAIDALVLSVALTIVWLSRFSDPNLAPETLLQDRTFLLSVWAAEWLYHAVMESSRWQATLGKRLLRLRVTNMRGERLGFGQASLRQIAKVLSALPFQAGYALAIFTAKRQALHDLITSCLVLRDE